MAKKNKNDDEAAGEPEVKLTAVTTLLPDPNDVKHNPNLLVETLRKAPARNHPRARSDAVLRDARVMAPLCAYLKADYALFPFFRPPPLCLELGIM